MRGQDNTQIWDFPASRWLPASRKLEDEASEEQDKNEGGKACIWGTRKRHHKKEETRRGQDNLRSSRVWCPESEAEGRSTWMAAQGQTYGAEETDPLATEKVPQSLNVNLHWRGEK